MPGLYLHLKKVIAAIGLLTAASLIIPGANVTRLFTHLSFSKRAIWSLENSRANASVVVSIVQGWSAIAVATCVGGTAPVCVASLIGVVLSGVVGIILTKGTESGDASASKRDIVDHVSGNFSALLDGGVNEIVTVTTPEAAIVFKSPGDHFNNLFKRDLAHGLQILALADYTINSNNITLPGLYAESDLGNHMIVSGSVVSHEELYHAVVTNGTDTKRAEEVTWISYNYKDTDRTYAQDWLNDYNNVQDGDELISETQSFIQQHGSNKYCVSAEKGGYGNQYQYVGYQNIVKGEVYLNAWGGLDNPCADAKDGADD